MAQEITSSVTVLQNRFRGGIRPQMIELTVVTPTTADTGDTILLTLSSYGIQTFLDIRGQSHTTENSVVVNEAPTTSVTAGVLTITLGGSGNTDKKRVITVRGYSGSI